jgi:metallo-beta-lactamase family protein
MVWLMDQLVTEGRMRAFPIHIDSPMAIDASRIYASYPEAHRVSLNNIGGRSLLHGKWIHLHRTQTESEALNKMKKPAMIILGRCSSARRPNSS